MNKKIKKKSEPSFFNTFMEFWITLPGMLTGIAAVITAIAGLYLAIGSPKNNNPHVPPTPTSSASSIQKSSSPTPESSPANYTEKEIAGADSIEVGGTSVLHLKDNVLRMKFTDNGQSVGAMSLKFYPDNALFKVE